MTGGNRLTFSAHRRGTAAAVLRHRHLYGRTIAPRLLPDPFRAGPLASTGGFSGPVPMEHGARPSGSGVRLLAGDALTGAGDGDRDNESRTFIYGRCGPDVHAIVVPLRHGRSVTATVSAGGWWEAWYPDGLGPAFTRLRSVTVVDAAGASHSQPLQS